MHGNPFTPPKAESTPGHDRPPLDSYSKNLAFMTAFLILPILLGVVGFIFFIAAAISLDYFVLPLVPRPRYDYHEMSISISLPINTIIGIASGFVFSFYFIGFARTAAIGVVLVALLGAITTCFVWRDSVLSNEGMGECTSAIVVYVPIFGFCAILVVLSMCSLFLKTRYNN
jgi:hypothetical protein